MRLEISSNNIINNMDGYLLSYNPNDFFWVSVQDQFDFTKCPAILNAARNTKPPSNMGTSIDTSGRACFIPPIPTCSANSGESCPTLPSTSWESVWGTWQKQTTAPTSTPITDFLLNQSYKNNANKSSNAENIGLNDAFSYQLCENYVKGNSLLATQNEVSTTQELFHDISDKTNMQLQNIFNVTGGILGIMFVGFMLTDQ